MYIIDQLTLDSLSIALQRMPEPTPSLQGMSQPSYPQDHYTARLLKQGNREIDERPPSEENTVLCRLHKGRLSAVGG